jgi:hypothetical protein
VIAIAENPIRTAFSNVKKDINDLRASQESANAGMLVQFEDQAKLIQKKTDALAAELKQKLEAQKRDLWPVVDAMEERIAEMRKLESVHEKNIIELRKALAQTEKKHAKIMTRLQDFEALAVEVDDVEKHFMTKPEADARIQKATEALVAETRAYRERVSRIEDVQGKSATREDLKKVEGQLIELKSDLVLQSAIEDANDRIDAVESKAGKRADGLQAQFRKIENDIADVYDLRKSYATKEQLSNIQKEIRMIMEGLKAAQKRDKVVKKVEKVEKKRGKKAQPERSAKSKDKGRIRNAVTSVKRFFIDEDVKK